MTEPVRAKLEVDVEEASEKANKFLDSFGASALGLNATFELVERAIEAVVAVMSAAIDLGRELLRLGEEQDAAERRLLTSARLRGQVTDGLLEQLGEFNDALLLQAGIGDDVSQSIEAQLLAMGVYRGDIEKATLAVIGFAEAHNVATQTAIKTIGRVVLGEVEALKRYGASATDVNEAIDRFAGFASLAEERSRRLSGEFNTLDESVGELGEEFGRILNNNEEVKRFVRDLTEDIVGLTRAVNENRDDIANFFSGILNNSREMFELFGKLVPLGNQLAAFSEQLRGAEAPPQRELVRTSLDPDPLAEARQKELETQNQKKLEEQAKAHAKFLKEQQRGEQQISDDMEQAIADRRERIDAQLELLTENRLGWIQERIDREVQAEQDANEILFQLRLDAWENEKNFEDQIENERIERAKKAFDDKIVTLTGFTKRYLDVAKLTERGLSDFQLQLINVGLGAFGVLQDGIAGTIGILLESAVTGGDAIGRIGDLFGGLLNKFADSLIGLGIGALALQLFSAIPFLAEFAGPPGASVAAGVAALAAGASIKLIAAALGAGGGGGSVASSTPTTGSTGRVFNTASGSGASDENQQRASEQAYIDRLLDNDSPTSSSSRSPSSGFSRSSGGGTIHNHHHVHVRGPVVGGRDRAARDLNRLQRRADQLAGRSYRHAG